MLPIYQSHLKRYARKLRKEMTDSERAFWKIVRKRQLCNLQFYRQKPIGNYIVDLYCPSAKIVIELDGSQHFTEDNLIKDKMRDGYLMQLGYKVLRFNDLDILKNKEGVIDKILMELKIPPNLPLQKGGV